MSITVLVRINNTVYNMYTVDVCECLYIIHICTMHLNTLALALSHRHTRARTHARTLTLFIHGLTVFNYVQYSVIPTVRGFIDLCWCTVVVVVVDMLVL